MARTPRRIAVIGAGVSGINAIVSLKEEGLDPVCFEYMEKPGGTWFYRNTSEDGFASLMPSTIINNSKEVGAFSTFPPKKESHNYMRHYELWEYIMDYAAHKDALRHIRCNSEVTSVKRSDGYDETGQWIVTVRNRMTKVVTSDVYDGVLVCVGHMNRPKIPSHPGQDAFKGKILHSHALKEVGEFKGKRVVVVGMGCSGMDAAVETSNVAKQVYISTRDGSHVMSRVGNNGFPFDFVSINRYAARFIDVHWQMAGWFLRMLYLDPRFDHSLYPVPPKRNILAKDPALNDHIISKILSGSIIQKKGIERFTENGVVFEDDLEETLVDVVIMATGYTWKFPFLEEGVLKQEDGMFKLYKCIFPAHLPHPTIAFIGFVLSWGPGFPILEMQTRFAASVMAGKVKLPKKVVMCREIHQRYERNIPRYGLSEKTSIRVDLVTYADDIASQIGAKPNFIKMFFTDIRLFFLLWWGHFVSYQYRLQGPHKWEGAREAIMTSKERVVYPLKRSNIPVENFFIKFVKRVLRFFLAREGTA